MLREGDVVVVRRLDRLGRSLKQLSALTRIVVEMDSTKSFIRELRRTIVRWKQTEYFK